MNIITVKVTRPETDTRVVVWERDDAHPNGEVFIAGPGEFQVAETDRVHEALRSGRLQRVEQKPKVPKQAAKKESGGKGGEQPPQDEEPPKS